MSPVLFNFYPSTVYKRKDQQLSPQSEIALDGKRGISEKRNSSPARTSHKPARVLQHRHETRTVRNGEIKHEIAHSTAGGKTRRFSSRCSQGARPLGPTWGAHRLSLTLAQQPDCAASSLSHKQQPKSSSEAHNGAPTPLFNRPVGSLYDQQKSQTLRHSPHRGR